MASHRRTVAAACAVILASISLYPIFTGTTWFWAGCGSAVVIALAGFGPSWIYAGPLLALVTAAGCGLAFFVEDKAAG